MTMFDVAEKLHELDDSRTIFAKRNPDWSATSEAVVCATPDDDSHPPEAVGFDYLLEVSIAKGAVEVWSGWRNGKQPTTAEKLDAVIYYAEYDCWLPLDGQKPLDPAVVRERFIATCDGFGEERCRWRDCTERRLKGLAFCYEHYGSRPHSANSSEPS
ncbi:MAG: hypothetical protein JWM68_5820 [Verrucomicrobiales bacterium]|nr:hypothetical protein [Verrucomicrobiales bacterium]